MKQSAKRLISLIGSIALIFGALVVFVNFIRPAYQSAQQAKGEVVSREVFLQNQRTAVEAVRNLIAAYEGEGDFAEVVALALPESHDQAQVVHQLGRLAAANQLTVQNIALEDRGASTAPVSARGTRAVSDSSAIVRPLGSLAVDMRMAGTYENWRTFLENVETNLRIMNVETVAVTPVGPSDENFYLFDMSVVAYYQLKSQ